MPTLLFAQNLQYSYSKDTQLDFPDISVNQEDDLLILGPSGSGKTTLLSLLGGIRMIQQGEVHIGNEKLHGKNQSELDRIRAQKAGFIFQQHHLIGSLSVEHNIQLSLSLAGIKVDETWMETLLDHLGIAPLRGKKAKHLSTGQQQRVAIARALIKRPQIVFADEPTSSLDDANAANVVSLFKELKQLSTCCFVIVTHDQRLTPHYPTQLTL